MSYSILDYGAMIADEARMGPYVEALRRSVKPGDVVIDLGAGAGLFAFLACEAGARRVYAIEPNDAIHVARRMAADNGLSDRIEFLQEFSTKITLPEQADVIVADLRGTLPLYNGHLKTLADARNRLLAPGGILIPRRDTLWAAVVNAPDLYRPYAEPWEEHNRGFDMRRARNVMINSWTSSKPTADQLLVEPKIWAEVDYLTVEQTGFQATLDWVVRQSGPAHGFIVWFDTVLCDGVGFTNAPGQTAKVYGSGFFPWTAPVALAEGDRICLDLKADPVDDDFVWTWKTQITSGDGANAAFHQSTFFAAVQSPAQLRKQAGAFTPSLNEDGEIARLTLSLMDGRRSQDEIVRQLLERFPRRFATPREALTHAAALAVKFSR